MSMNAKDPTWTVFLVLNSPIGSFWMIDCTAVCGWQTEVSLGYEWSCNKTFSKKLTEKYETDHSGLF